MSVKKKCFSMSKGFLLIKNGMFSKKISYAKNWINPNRSLVKIEGMSADMPSYSSKFTNHKTKKHHK